MTKRDLDPTATSNQRAWVRPFDHHRRGHGAVVDRDAVGAFFDTCRERRRLSSMTALVTGRRRMYTEAERKAANDLCAEAARLREIAEDKPAEDQRRFVLGEAERLEAEAAELVPKEFW